MEEIKQATSDEKWGIISSPFTFFLYLSRWKKNLLAIGIVVALVLVITPATADYNFDGWPLQTRASGTVNGGVFIDYVPWDGSTNLTLSTNVPNRTVKLAYLYTGVWGTNEYKSGWVNVTLNGVADRNGLGPAHLQGAADTNPHVWCTTHGKNWMYYNVTDLVKAGSTNTAIVSKINGSIDGRVYGIVLVVVYEGGDNPKALQYWINDGHDALHYAISWPPIAAHDSGTTEFDGTVDTRNLTEATLTLVHLTAYEDYYNTSKKGCCEKCLQFNGHELDTTMVDSNTFELNSWNVTEHVNSSVNTAWYTRMDEDCDDQYVSITNAILVVERTNRSVGSTFGTGSSAQPYPSSAGIHAGTIEMNEDISVSRMYTYPCTGTGGHTEFIRIWNTTTGACAEGHWDGYGGDYQNISLNRSIILEKNLVYNYVICTGSYPQIHHEKELAVDGGIIRSATFTDLNGREHEDWIPAFQLY
jgi:hypothetical protein